MEPNTSHIYDIAVKDGDTTKFCPFKGASSYYLLFSKFKYTNYSYLFTKRRIFITDKSDHFQYIHLA